MLFDVTESGKEGLWRPDLSDSTTADNTGTVVVTVDNKRIKRVLSEDNFFSASWFGNSNIWFTSISDATTKIPVSARFKGLTVLVDISGTPTEYWWLAGTTNGDLVLKSINLAGMTTGSIPFISSAGSLIQDNSNLFWDDTNDRLGIGLNNPTSVLHLKAGGAPAGRAPLKLTAGTNLSTPENGAFEFDGVNFFATSSGTRFTLARTLTSTATLDFGSTTAQTSSDLTITLNGAVDGDVVLLGIPSASITANTSFTAWVSAANTVTVRFNNYSAATVDPASGTFRISVLKY